MSASRWSVCPKCYIRRQEEKEILERELSDSYGKISVGEFNELQARREQALAELENSSEDLREDYEFYMDKDGNFSADYHAKCDNCGFEFEFHHKEKINITEPESEGKDETE